MTHPEHTPGLIQETITQTLVYLLLVSVLPISSVAQVTEKDGEASDVSTVSAVVRPQEDSAGATGKSMISGSVYRGDVMHVLQKLNDELSTDNGGSGGKILLNNGEYVTDEELSLESGIHLQAESRHGAKIRLKDGTSVENKGYTFVSASGENIVIDGVSFRSNRDAEQVSSRLTRDAGSGTKTLYLENAGPFEGRGKAIGIGRPSRNMPGGLRLRDGEHSERIMVGSVNTDENALDVRWGGVRKRYTVDRNAEVVFYPSVQGIVIHGGKYVVRNCRFVNMQEGCGVRAGGGSDGLKVLENNSVIDLHGGTGIRLHRVNTESVIRGNYIDGCMPGYNSFWGEGVSLENNTYTVCTGNVIKGPGDRLLRANYVKHSVISNNVVRTPLDTLPVGTDSGWEPLRGDETVSGEKMQGGSADQPGIVLSEPGEKFTDWSGWNRVHMSARGAKDDVDVFLRLVDSDGNHETFRTVTWVGGESQIISFDLFEPAASDGQLNREQIEEVQLFWDTHADDFTFHFGNMKLGQPTGWGLILWGAKHTTAANNTFYGIGAERGAIYYGNNSSDLTITGNTIAYSYDGIGWAGEGGEKRLTIADNTLFATMGGIRGDGIVRGNTIAYAPSNDRTKYTINARLVNGNHLLKTRGIRFADPEARPAPREVKEGWATSIPMMLDRGYMGQPAEPTPSSNYSISNNTVKHYQGPAVSLEEDDAIVSDNVFRTAVNEQVAVRQASGTEGHLITGNKIKGGHHAFVLSGSDSVVSGNMITEITDEPIPSTGTGNTIRNNKGAPLSGGTVTLRSGKTPAARLNGVSTDGTLKPAVKSINPEGDSAPDTSYSYESYLEWDADAGEWDVVVEWKTDPGRDLRVTIRVDQP